MISSMQSALIKKDIRSVTSNKNLMMSLLIVPVFMAVVLPMIFLLIVGLSPIESSDFQDLLAILPEAMMGDDVRRSLIQLILNNIVPIFFLIIPIMTASIMAASSFVGEKEKRTLETLLYSPLSLRNIFSAKILAAFILSQFVSLTSFVAMMVVAQSTIWFIAGAVMLPGLNWLVLLLLVSPGISLVAISLIVRGSAKAKSMEESQQRSTFLILPILLLAIGQFTGVMMLSVGLLLGVGIACALAGFILLRRSSADFHYEQLLL